VSETEWEEIGGKISEENNEGNSGSLDGSEDMMSD